MIPESYTTHIYNMNSPFQHLIDSPISNSKVLLAKFMAQENIRVIRDNSRGTAYFDVENRILGLPSWGDMSDDLYSMLIGHEVGHALFTPKYKLEEEKAEHKFYEHAIQLLEDARIDRRIKKKFPGISKNYREATKELVEKRILDLPENFSIFRNEKGEVIPLSFLDRLTIHLKAADHAEKVPFSAKELPFVYGMEETETFEEVIALADEIFDYLKEELENEEEQPQEQKAAGGGSGQGESKDEEKEGKGDKSEDGDSESEKQRDPGTKTGEEEKEEHGEDLSDASDNKSDDGRDQGASRILEDFNKNISDLTGQEPDALGAEKVPGNVGSKNKDEDSSGDLFELDVTNINALPYVYYYTDCVYDLHSLFYEIANPARKNEIDTEIRKFASKTSRIINHMVQEFNMKKAARESIRSSTAKSGRLNMSRLHAYRTSEDIFQSFETKKKGKNHGFLIFVDFSGSMYENFSNCILQLFNLVLFCQTANLSFEVYGFTDNGPLGLDKDDDCLYGQRLELRRDETRITEQLLLNNYFSSRMNRSEIFFSMRSLYAYAQELSRCEELHLRGIQRRAYRHFLSGTPLNATVVVAKDLFWRFKSENKLDIVHSIFITDGYSDIKIVDSPNTTDFARGTFINGPFEYPYHPGNGTSKVLEMMRDETDSKAVLMFLSKNDKDLEKLSADCKEFSILPIEQKRKYINDFHSNGYVEIPSYYDKSFIINPSLIGIDSGSSTYDLASQIKARPMLRSFIETIAI